MSTAPVVELSGPPSHPAGSVIVVTGAGSGIGQATAVLAARQGFVVAAWDVNGDGLARTAAAAGAAGSFIRPMIADVTDAPAIAQAMAGSAALGPLAGLVNNAGPVAIGREPQFGDTVRDAIASVQMMTDAFMAAGPASGAAVVNIASVVGPVVAGGAAWYCAAKAGIVGYTRYMAVTHGARIRFNCIAPGGPIRTPRNAAFIDEGRFAGHLARNPLRRPGRPEEVAAGILFLLSPAASYVNGVMLPIDGGLSVAE